MHDFSENHRSNSRYSNRSRTQRDIKSISTFHTIYIRAVGGPCREWAHIQQDVDGLRDRLLMVSVEKHTKMVSERVSGFHCLSVREN